MASSDIEDEDLKTAIAMSLAAEQTNGSTTQSPSPRTKVSSNLDPKQASGVAGIDRKAMEEERLARLARKRERSVSPPALKGSRKAPKIQENTTVLPSGAMLRTFTTLVDQDQRGRKSETANSANQQLRSPQSKSAVKQEPTDDEAVDSKPGLQGSLQYPHGVVKKTWAYGFERTGDDIKLEELLEPLTLRTAVLSAFQWDTDWVVSKLKIPPEGQTKCIFVMQAKEEEQRQEMMKNTEEARSFLRLCFPPMDGQIHCMHSKLMLLFHPNKLRVAIPTANLLNFDWGETGVMENSVFTIDLPRLPDGGKAKAEDLSPFAEEMLHYLEMQELDEDVRNGVLNFDFSATQGMMFVHTAGGVHTGVNVERTGLLGLARAVRKLNLQTEKVLEIDFAASSIGSLNDEQLQKFHAAARGQDLVEREKQLKSQAKANFFNSAAKKPLSESSRIQDKMRIYFPTEDTVTNSIAGAAGTICLQRKWFEGSAFPRACFRDYRSTRDGLLSHNKILYARGKQKQADGSTKDVAWVYVGSSNMSESAWGKISFDSKLKAWKMNCKNWECGVLLPVPAGHLDSNKKVEEEVKREHVDGEDSETESEDEGGATDRAESSKQLIGMEVFDNIVKPPFEIPGRKYDGRQPWYFTEPRQV